MSADRPACRPDPFRLLTDPELERMTARAWSDAARAWSEARAYRAGAPDRLGRFPADALLRSAADAADADWYRLVDERRRRSGLPPSRIGSPYWD